MIPGSKQWNNQRRWILAIWLLAVTVSLVMPLASIEALATTIYSYIDDQGTPVITDNFKTIPERYRARVRTTEQATDCSSNCRWHNSADDCRTWAGSFEIWFPELLRIFPGSLLLSRRFSPMLVLRR